MSNEDRIRFSFLLIITVIVFTMNVRMMTQANRRGLNELDALFDGYLTSTARQWAVASAADAQQQYAVGYEQNH
ncbi:MAG: hypothetical protein Q4C86_08245 [bacterium]|nr:hypothetical protein [bacterium]